MTQLIENKHPRRALIATLSHFDDPTRVVVLSDHRESKDLLSLPSSPRAFLIANSGIKTCSNSLKTNNGDLF